MQLHLHTSTNHVQILFLLFKIRTFIPEQISKKCLTGANLQDGFT